MSDLEEAILMLCDDPLDASCAHLKKAMDGFGTDEDTLNFTIGGKEWHSTAQYSTV